MEETDKIYKWISAVIKSCEEQSHIEPCEVLIKFYEKKKPSPYIIDKLREELNVQILIMQNNFKKKEIIKQEDKIWEMFTTGSHTIKQISELLNINLQKCNEIVSKKLKGNN